MSEQLAVSSSRSAEDGEGADRAGRRIIVILGSGRSGTSLCAKILGRLGIRMEATLQRPNEMNPEGYFEDGRLVEINKRLLGKLAPVPGSGPRGDAAAKVGPEMRELREHLKKHAFSAPEIWGFKDPRVSLLLPFYRRAFQAVGVVPRYVFCARAPGAVVESLQQAGTRSRAFYEQVYFMRSFLALRDSAANCHVIHYERLLEDPVGQISKLWAYVGDESPTPLTPEECEALVDKKLNRSQLRAAPVSNPLAARMGVLIDGMEGNELDRDAVFAELREIDAIHSAYQVWVDSAADSIGAMKMKAETAEGQLAKQAERIAKLTEAAETRAEESVELADARKSAAKQTEEIGRLRTSLQAALKETERRSGAAETRIAALSREAEGRAAAEARADDLAEQVKTMREQTEEACAAAEHRAKEAEARNVELTAQHERVSVELARTRDEALAHAGRQEACATVLGAELSILQADLARLEKERNAAVTRTRSREGEFEEMRGTLEQTAIELTRVQRSEKKLKIENEQLQARLQAAERGAVEAEAEGERLREQLRQCTEKLSTENERLRARLQTAERCAVEAEIEGGRLHEQLRLRTDKLKIRNRQLLEQLQRRTEKLKTRNQTLRAKLQKAERWNILALPRRLARSRSDGRPDETSR